MPVLSLDSRGTISGLNVCVNTWHISVNGQPLVSEANNLVNAVNAFYNGFTAYRQGTMTTGTRVLYWLESWWTKPTFDANHKQLTKGFFNVPPTIVAATSATCTTGSGGGAIPPQLASVVSWRSATSGRSGRARTYLGNLGSAAQTGSIVTGTAVAAINTAASTLITAIHAITAAGAAADLGVWSPTKGWILPILSGASDGTWDTMRSRVK
jgi:hypothetical protein